MPASSKMTIVEQASDDPGSDALEPDAPDHEDASTPEQRDQAIGDGAGRRRPAEVSGHHASSGEESVDGALDADGRPALPDVLEQHRPG